MKDYESPRIEVQEVLVEKGFLESGRATIIDWNNDNFNIGEATEN